MEGSIIFYLAIAVFCTVYAVCIFFGKGPIFSAAYFAMDKEGRKKMKSKEECRSMSLIFGGVAVLTILMAIGELAKLEWMKTVVLIWAAVLVILIFARAVRKGIKK
ncbi:MAG: DUF3784 domain-containing protein [Clostridiales bacterium]|nr:DUF3784 domain-containing protein [Clostridiales bacterium]